MLYWQLAAQEGGYQSIALNPALSGAEIQRHRGPLRGGRARAARRFRRPGRPDDRHRVRSRCGCRSGGDIPGFTTYESLVEGQPTTEPPERRLGIPISYSSGTTGQPKAVVRPRTPRIDPSVAADAMKSFGHAFQFQPFDRGAPGLGRHAPRRLPGLLSRCAQRRAGARHPGQVRSRGDAGGHRAATG